MTSDTTPENLLDLANGLNAEATAITQVLLEVYDQSLHAERDLLDLTSQILIKLSNLRTKRLATLAEGPTHD